MKYIVITRGLSNITQCKCINEVKKEVTRLKKMGYKYPIIYEIKK